MKPIRVYWSKEISGSFIVNLDWYKDLDNLEDIKSQLITQGWASEKQIDIDIHIDDLEEKAKQILEWLNK